MNTSIEMVEVSARDGLQNEPGFFPTSDKLELISRAIAAGSKRIEVASFVHPGRVPQMADAEAVCAALPKRSREDVTYIGLTLNKRGALRALETQVHELGSVVCATDGFGTRNQGRTSDETLEDAIEIIRLAKEHGRSAHHIRRERIAAALRKGTQHDNVSPKRFSQQECGKNDFAGFIFGCLHVLGDAGIPETNFEQ